MPFKKGVTPPGAKPFKKGQSGNVKGQPRKLISVVISDLKKEGIAEVSKVEIKSVYMMLLNLKILELEERVKDNNQPALVRIVGKAILSNKGFDVIERVLDRAMGKPTQEIENIGNAIIVQVGHRNNDE